MKVSHASQVLSSTVSCNINTCVACGLLPPEAAFTAEFCEKLDKLFDSVNSSTLVNPIKPIKGAVTANSSHVQFWKEMICWLKDVKFCSVVKIWCVEGWILTLSAFIQLWQDLNCNYNVRYMLTRNINQDAIENLFSICRIKCGCNDNPTSNHFRYALKAATIHHIAYPHNNSNCENDNYHFLTTLLKDTERPKKQSIHNISATSCSNEIERYQRLCEPEHDQHNTFESNILAYISGYLCSKVLKHHNNCGNCNHLIRSNPNLDDPTLLYTYFKASDNFGPEFGNLTVPSSACTTMIKTFDHIFIETFNDKFAEHGLGIKIEERIRNGVSSFQRLLMICDVTLTNMIKLFVKMRICHAVKQFNQKLKSSKRKDRKYLKVSHL